MSFHVALWIHLLRITEHFIVNLCLVLFLTRVVTSRELLHVHVVVLPHVGGGGGEVVVDPHLVDRQAEGEDVEGGRDPAVLGRLPVGVADPRPKVVGRLEALLRLDQLQVLDEGHRVVVHEYGHEGQLEDAPDAEQGAAQ